MTERTDSPLDRVVVALDTDDWDTFHEWAEYFGPRVGVLKVGLEAFVRWGDRAVELARSRGRRLFLDLKLHDIPATVAGAVTGARRHGADLLTVHAAGGPEMLGAAVEAAEGEVDLVAVTLLTHLDTAALDALALPGPAPQRVRRWAGIAHRAGCAGVVCSPREAAALRAEHPRPFQLVTPGIRPTGSATDDQRRVATPAAALAAGADLLVIGRPLTRASDRDAALTDLERELDG